MNTLLISETTLKRHTPTNANVNSEYIMPAIAKAQDIGLQPLIGSVLLNRLCALVADGTIEEPANVAYKRLLDEHITPYLCNKAVAELQPVLFAKIRNEGLVTSQDQQTQQLSMAECEYIRNKYEHDATFYAGRLTDYLHANAAAFPEYCRRDSAADLPRNPNAFKTPIVL